MIVSSSLQLSRHHTKLAHLALAEAGLQVPSAEQMEAIVRSAYCVALLLWMAALEKPTNSDLDEVFRDFVLRCVNRAPGVGDVLV